MEKKNSMNETMRFGAVEKEYTSEAEKIILTVIAALEEKGYNPVNQLVGYILSGDPTYITSHKNARSIIRRLERDEILEEIVKDCTSAEDHKPRMKGRRFSRILGLDLGDRTVGVAVSDGLGLTAQGVEIIRRNNPSEHKQSLGRIAELIEEYGVDTIVLGYPKILTIPRENAAKKQGYTRSIWKGDSRKYP